MRLTAFSFDTDFVADECHVTARGVVKRSELPALLGLLVHENLLNTTTAPVSVEMAVGRVAPVVTQAHVVPQVEPEVVQPASAVPVDVAGHPSNGVPVPAQTMTVLPRRGKRTTAVAMAAEPAPEPESPAPEEPEQEPSVLEGSDDEPAVAMEKRLVKLPSRPKATPVVSTPVKREAPPGLLKEKRTTRILTVLSNAGWSFAEVLAWCVERRDDIAALKDVPDVQERIARMAKHANLWGMEIGDGEE
jgi:hypothetical protein